MPEANAKRHSGQLWYVRHGKEVHGPFPAGLVSRYILLGRVREEDEVSTDRKRWQCVADVPELIPEVLLASRDPDNEEARRQLEAAKRWADEHRLTPRHAPPAPRVSRMWSYGAIAGLVLVVAALPFVLPAPARVSEAQCDAPPAPGVVWRDCPLPGRNLPNVDLGAAVLRSAHLSGSLFRAANFTRADLSYADLSFSGLRGANFTAASLVGTNLRGADLAGANLHGADLSYADVTGATLEGANLADARLDYVVWSKEYVCMPGSIGECRLAQR